MDIAKYIIQFLIKNRYCSLPGLGYFELNKTSSAIKTDTGEIIPAKFEVKFSPLGTIDDNFASFIAGHENVSISNTSNNIKTFCKEVKQEIAERGKYTIDNFGYLTQQNNKITFVQTDELDMGTSALPLPSIDAQMKSGEGRKLDFSYPAAHSISYRRKKTSVGKFLVPTLIVLGLAVGGYFAVKYLSDNQPKESAPENTATLPLQQNNNITPPTQDTTAIKDSAATPAVVNTPVANSNGMYKVALYSSTDEASATAKANKWKNYGHQAEVSNTNGNFVVSILASHPSNDTLKLVDSLRKFFNPKGVVYILK